MQPWRFVWDGEKLACWIDEARAGTFLDVDNLASLIALGASVENLALASTSLGRAATVDTLPEPGQPLLACQMRFGARATMETAPLFEFVPQRVTNRRLAPPRSLEAVDEACLRGALELEGARLHLVTERESMAQVGAWLGRTDRLRFLSPVMHAELIRELRWSAEEVARTRDGVDLATLDVSASDRAVLRLLSAPSTMSRLKRMGGGAALERPSEKAVAASSALALLSVPGTSRPSYLDGGRQLQRLWLAATSRRLAVQPVGPLPFLLTRLERRQGDNEVRSVLGPVRRPFRKLFDVPEGHALIMLFRIAYADRPTARSLRRPVDEVLTFADATNCQ
jgi:hypothetical protein